MRRSGRARFGVWAAHWVHRVFGSVFGVLLAVWFASGAVMTVARYPEYSERERLAQAEPLAGAIAVPAEIEAFIARGGLADGDRIRLVQLEGRATWSYSDREGLRHALRASDASAVTMLDAERARREVERRSARSARVIGRSVVPDQWTVGRSRRGDYPLFRVALDDAQGSEFYVSARSGEIVQQSTRSERVWCWLGAIPHWIYPAMLRRNFDLWRDTVLWLAAAGLVVTLSGLIAGLRAQRVRSRARLQARQRRSSAATDLVAHHSVGLDDRVARRGRALDREPTQDGSAEPASATGGHNFYLRGERALPPADEGATTPPTATDGRNFYFRWHQRIGLAFGLFASGWLFSGALSLAPFDWNGPDVSPEQLATLHSAQPRSFPIAAALARCSEQLHVRELELAAFADLLVAICSDENAQTRIVDLNDPTLKPQRHLALNHLRPMAARLARGTAFELSMRGAPDAYYYPTHSEPEIAVPFAVLQLHDEPGTTFYLDPRRAALISHFSDRKRIERWLYHGLHNLDFPSLYQRSWLWYGVLWLAMGSGFALAALGLLMRLRRFRLQLRRLPNNASAAEFRSHRRDLESTDTRTRPDAS